MTKLVLNTVASGFLGNVAMTDNFQKISDEFQNKVLYRNNPTGEPNSMQQDLDMNGFRILNQLAISGDGFTYKGSWTAGTSYSINNIVNVTSGTYTGYAMIALTSLTSLANFDLDFATGKWGIFASRGASGAGTGDMLAANNLNDVANKASARSNLSVPSLAQTPVITSSTGSAAMPAGSTAQRDASPLQGYTRFNNSLNKLEAYSGSGWVSSGGATGGGSDDIFYENSQIMTTNYTITAGKNAMCVGQLTINSGVTLTIPSGSRLVVL